MKIWAFTLMFIGGLISCQSNASSTSENNEQLEQQNSIAVSLETDSWEKKMSETPGKILDVRTDAEYEEGYIEGALHADVLESNFVDNLSALSINKDDPIYVYCRSGQRSKKAMGIISAQGYTQVYELNSGIIGWQNAGKPVVK